MQSTVRTSSVARIGRSYPRATLEAGAAEASSRGGLQVAGGIIALLLALGLIGWLLAR